MFTHQFCHGGELLQHHFEQGPSAHGQGCVRNREVVLLAPEEAGVILASPNILMIHSQSSVVQADISPSEDMPSHVNAAHSGLGRAVDVHAKCFSHV